MVSTDGRTDGRTDTEGYNIIPRHTLVAGYKKSPQAKKGVKLLTSILNILISQCDEMKIITKSCGSGLKKALVCLRVPQAAGQVKILIFQVEINFFPYIRPPDKSVHWKIIFLISQPKHMLWVLKRTVSMRCSF